MDGQEAFKRIQQQLKRAANQGGGKMPGGPSGLFAGGGLIVALIAGGLALNASLFNGTRLAQDCLFGFLIMCAMGNSGWWSPSDQVHTVSS
jgi:hypothetical protein